MADIRISSPSLWVAPVSTKAELRRFIDLPVRLHRDDPHYVQPLRMERKQALSPKTNPFFEHAEVQLWLAVRDGPDGPQDVGRISAQIDALAPDKEAGHFGLLAAEDDAEVVVALLATAEAWLRARGKTRVLGPFNLSVNEEVGLLVDGFDSPPMLLMPHDRSYLAPRVEAAGYAKARDLFAFLNEADDDLPKAVRRRLDRGLPEGVTLRQVDMGRFAEEVATLTDILNDAWADNWGFTPTTAAETAALAKALKPIIDPSLVWFIEIDGETAGFIVALPNVNEAIADLNGRLLPFGWARLLWRLKTRRIHSCRVPLMGVRRRYWRQRRGQLAPFILIDRVWRETRRLGFMKQELSWVLEDNGSMRSIAEAVGARRYKTYRVYEKALDGPPVTAASGLSPSAPAAA